MIYDIVSLYMSAMEVKSIFMVRVINVSHNFHYTAVVYKLEFYCLARHFEFTEAIYPPALVVVRRIFNVLFLVHPIF